MCFNYIPVWTMKYWNSYIFKYSKSFLLFSYKYSKHTQPRRRLSCRTFVPHAGGRKFESRLQQNWVVKSCRKCQLHCQTRSYRYEHHGFLDETLKTKVPCQSRVASNKTPHCRTVMSTGHIIGLNLKPLTYNCDI